MTPLTLSTGQISPITFVPAGSRVTLSGSGSVEWTPGSPSTAATQANWQTWALGSTTGYQDTLRPLCIRVTATASCTVTIEEGRNDKYGEDAYWEEDIPVFAKDSNGHVTWLVGPSGAYFGITRLYRDFFKGEVPTVTGIRSMVWTYETIRMVAVGDTGTILTSTTGDVWTQQTSGVTVNLRRVRQLWDMTIVVGDAPAGAPGTILIAGTNDTWTARTTNTGNNIHLYDVAYQPLTMLLACGTADASGPVIVKSVDRNAGTPFTTWELLARTGLTGVGDGLCMTYAGGYFWMGTSSGYIMKSADGATWTQVYYAAGNKFYKIVYANGRLLALSGAFVGSSVYSDDLSTFTAFNTNFFKPWRDLDCVNGIWVACNDTDAYPYLSTDNGITFHPLMCGRDYTSAQFKSSALLFRPYPLTYFNPLGDLAISETENEAMYQLLVGDSVGGKIYRSLSF